MMARTGGRYYYVYILTNRSKTLYTGVTNNLSRRLFEHRNGSGEFTSHYKLDTLVYYERFGDVRSAIDREKQIKGLRRIKKIALIVSVNPAWQDLSVDWPL
jgi:putative endonuclease